MKMNKKAFTLVELLAVIVILSVIALIATPIVLNAINEAKESSVLASVQNYARAIDTTLYNENIEGNIQVETCKVILNNKESYIKCNGYDEEILIDVKAQKPTDGILRFRNNVVNDYELYIDGYLCTKKENLKCVKATKTNITITEPLTTIIDNKSTILNSYRIYGNSVQDGTPDPENSIEIKNVGDLITDINDPNYGKYEIKIKIKGKQLVDKNNLIDGYVKPDGTVETVNWYKCTDFIEVNGDYLTYSNSAGTSSSARHYAFYDVNKKFISGGHQKTEEEGHTSYTILIPQGAKYFRYNISLPKVDTAMVELGNTFTEYEPHKEKSYSIYLNEPLRCVKDVCDYIDLEKGQVVRKIYKQESDNQLYELANYIYEDIEIPRMELNDDISNIIIDTETIPSKIELEYYK